MACQLNPDIPKIFFSLVGSKLPSELKLAVFMGPDGEHAYNACKGPLLIAGGVLDPSRMDKIAYVDEVAETILAAYKPFMTCA